ncbi:hypothetical protein BDV19DRAFT_213019 [Aspergillus venezuelensis]
MSRASGTTSRGHWLVTISRRMPELYICSFRFRLLASACTPFYSACRTATMCQVPTLKLALGKVLGPAGKLETTSLAFMAYRGRPSTLYDIFCTVACCKSSLSPRSEVIAKLDEAGAGEKWITLLLDASIEIAVPLKFRDLNSKGKNGRFRKGPTSRRITAARSLAHNKLPLSDQISGFDSYRTGSSKYRGRISYRH